MDCSDCLVIILFIHTYIFRFLFKCVLDVVVVGLGSFWRADASEVLSLSLSLGFQPLSLKRLALRLSFRPHKLLLEVGPVNGAPARASDTSWASGASEALGVRPLRKRSKTLLLIGPQPLCV